ncbi:MAG: alpha/beta hydrolase [Pseudomonadota bacterium]|nr:alpha/beta hydrolase [Pseudomonadota bacterium]
MTPIVPTAPRWFRDAVTARCEDRYIQVEGAWIHYRHWVDAQRETKPGLLFVHGGGAHAHWWDFIAPQFAASHSVAALDLSGMGDSDHRGLYPPETFAKEIVAVCDAAGFDNRAIVIAHSFGGFGTIKAGHLYPERFAGIMIVDTVVMSPEAFEKRDETNTPFRPKKTYPDLETALTRFKLVPEQPCDNDFILDYIARHSLMNVSDGVMWKFDHLFNQKMDYRTLVEDIPQLTLPRVVIHGADSVFFKPDSVAWMQEIYGPAVPFIPVENAQHHVFLDEPLGFVRTVRGVMDQWSKA